MSIKTPQMVEFLDGFSEQLFGRTRSDSIKSQTCVTCGGKAEEFNDDVSRKEYAISGMCQECQNSFFK